MHLVRSPYDDEFERLMRLESLFAHAERQCVKANDHYGAARNHELRWRTMDEAMDVIAAEADALTCRARKS